MFTKTIFKLLKLLFLFYTAFFLISGIAAPVLAKYKFFILADKLYTTLALSCHQQPLRSFWILGYPMAICARCTGIYAGVLISAFNRILLKTKINLYIAVLLLVIGSLEIALEKYTSFTGNNFYRLISGLMIGWSLIGLFMFFTDYFRRLLKK